MIECELLSCKAFKVITSFSEAMVHIPLDVVQAALGEDICQVSQEGDIKGLGPLCIQLLVNLQG